jgi:hypothetical protein
LDTDGTVFPEQQTVVDSVRCAAAVIPLLLKYQGTGKVHSVIQEDLLDSRLMEFEGYTGLIEFGGRKPGYNGKDWHHSSPPGPRTPDSNRGRGMIIQASKDEFYLVGANYRLFLRPKMSMEEMKPRLAIMDAAPKLPGWHLVSVDEGNFDEKGNFVINRSRNGDEVDPAVWVEPDCGVIRVITCD